jgi:hypothetical protein
MGGITGLNVEGRVYELLSAESLFQSWVKRSSGERWIGRHDPVRE